MGMSVSMSVSVSVRMRMWVRVVVKVGMVCLCPADSAQRRHGVRTGILTQGSEGWGIRAQVWTPKPDAKSTLRASNNLRAPCHGREKKRMRNAVRERGMQMMRGVNGVGV